MMMTSYFSSVMPIFKEVVVFFRLCQALVLPLGAPKAKLTDGLAKPMSTRKRERLVGRSRNMTCLKPTRSIQLEMRVGENIRHVCQHFKNYYYTQRR
jgi:hypothetical protein